MAPPAFASDAAKFNKKLDSLGLPPLGEIPDGYNPLITAYSQEAPLLVQFLYPSNWLVVKPSSNTNGEAGAARRRREKEPLFVPRKKGRTRREREREREISTACCKRERERRVSERKRETQVWNKKERL